MAMTKQEDKCYFIYLYVVGLGTEEGFNFFCMLLYCMNFFSTDMNLYSTFMNLEIKMKEKK